MSNRMSSSKADANTSSHPDDKSQSELLAATQEKPVNLRQLATPRDFRSSSPVLFSSMDTIKSFKMPRIDDDEEEKKEQKCKKPDNLAKQESVAATDDAEASPKRVQHY